MNHIQAKRIFFVLFFLSVFFPVRIQAETFIGELQTGVVEIKDFKYPVFMYIPNTVKPDRRYPLIIAIPNFGESPEQSLETWKSLANRKTFLVLAPTYLEPQDVPYDYDRWLLMVKALITSKYPVNPEKIYLIGKEKSAPYVGYLGVNFPEEFTSVGLVGGSWIGRYEKLMRLETNPSKQLPFFITLKEDQGDLLKETQTEAYAFTKKGYLIQLTQFQKGEEFLNSDFKKEFINWLEEKGEQWHLAVKKNQKTFKEKTKRAIKGFFTV